MKRIPYKLYGSLRIIFLMPVIFLAGELKAQTTLCPTLGGTNLAICYGESSTTLSSAFTVSGKNPNPATVITWYKTDGTVIANSGGTHSTSLSAADYVAPGAVTSFTQNTAGQLHQVLVTQTVPGVCTESVQKLIVVLQQPQLGNPAAPTSTAPAVGVCNGSSITLTSDSPGNVTVNSSITLQTQIRWMNQGYADAAFDNPVPSKPLVYYTNSATVTFGVSPEPFPNVSRVLLYQREFRLVQVSGYGTWTKACRSNESSTITIRVWPRPTNVGTISPTSVIVCTGVNNDLTLTSQNWDGGSTYVSSWERTFGGLTTSFPTDQSVLTQSLAAAGTYTYHVKLTRGNGANNPACTLKTTDATVIAQQFDLTNPEDSRVCVGENTSFESTITYGSAVTPTLQWQVERANGTFVNDNTGTSNLNITPTQITSSFNVTNVAATSNSYRYQLVATNGTTCSKTTQTARLLVGNPPIVSLNLPTAKAVCEGELFSLAARATGTGQIKYQWQRKPSAQGTWGDVGEQVIPAAGSSSTLNIAATEVTVSGMNGAVYRVQITDDNCSQNTGECTITLKLKPVIIDNTFPQDAVACEGSTGVFNINATGTGTITYQWIRTDNIDVDINVGTSSNTYTTPAVSISEYHNNHYRVTLVDGNGCQPVLSRRALLTVNPLPTINTPPVSTAKCENEDASFTVAGTANSGTLSYQWEEASPTGTFAAIPASNVSATTATLAFTAVASAKNGYQYRVKLSNGANCFIYTNPVTLTVRLRPAINPDLPAAAIACSGVNFIYTTGATTSNPRSPAPTMTYEWFEDIGATGTFSALTANANSTTLTLNIAYNAANTANNTRKYKVKITDAYCLTETAISVLTLNPIPNITAQPQSSTVCTGESKNFSVTGTGPAPRTLTYSWQEDTNNDGIFTNISPSQEAATLSVSNPLATNRYQVILNNGICSAKSSVAILTVNSVPDFTSNPGIPASTTGCTNNSYTYSAPATAASGTVTWQWQIEQPGGSNTFVNISGATNSTYTLNSVALSDEGKKFQVVIAVGSCSRISNVSTFHVVAGPAITVDPQNQTICNTENAVFTVGTITTGTTSQWQQDPNTGTFTNLEGQTSNTLTLTEPAASTNGYKYRAIISLGSCSKASAAATLTVNAGPVIAPLPAIANVCVGQDYQYTASVSGLPSTATIVWQWKKWNGVSFAAIAGATNAAFTVLSAQAVNDAQYLVEATVQGTVCKRISNTSTLRVNAYPSINPQPASQTVCTGDNVVFTTGGSSNITDINLTYQWQESQGSSFSNLTGETNSTLTFSNVSGKNGFKYRAILSNGQCNITTTPDAILTLTTSPTVGNPASAEICVGISHSFLSNSSGGTLKYQWQDDSSGTFTNVGTESSDNFIYVNPGTTRNYRVIVRKDNTSCSRTSSAVSLTVNPIPVLTVLADQSACLNQSAYFSISASGGTPPYVTYRWLQGTTSVITSSSMLTLTNLQSADNGKMYTVLVTDSKGCARISNQATLHVSGNLSITQAPASQTVCSNQTAEFTVEPATLTYQWQEASATGAFADIPYATTNRLILNAANKNGYRYVVKVSNSSCTQSTPVATLTTNISPAFKDALPEPAIACPGFSYTFHSGAYSNVTVAGGTSTYSNTGVTWQWQVANSSTSLFSDIPGATATDYTINLIDNSYNGKRYRVEAKYNGACPRVTNISTIDATSGINITGQPQPQSICNGDNAVFSVATSMAGVTYQWQQGDTMNGTFTDVAGYTSQTLTINAPGRSNFYLRAVLSRGGCTKNSNAALLTLNAPPNTTITNPAAVCDGQDFIFTSSVTPTRTYTYQWKRLSGTAFNNITNATGANYTLPGATLTADNNAQFQVDVTIAGTQCTRPSNISVLTVNSAPTVTGNPASKTVCIGDNSDFTAAGTTTIGTLSYQWQEATSGAAFTDMVGKIAATLTLTNVQATMSSNQYRAVLSNGFCPSNTTAATLTVIAPPNPGTLPAAAETCYGVAYRLSNTATNINYRYQWMVENNEVFETNGAEITNNYLDITNPVVTKRYKVLVRVNATSCQRESNISTLTVNPLPLLSVVADQSGCLGNTATFSVTVSSGTAPYTWQWKEGNQTVGTLNPFTTSLLTSVDDGRMFTVTVTDSKTCTATSTSAARLTVYGPPVIRTQPVSKTVCSDKTAIFTIEATQSGIPVQWQEATSATGAFSSIAGAVSNSYTVNVAAGKNGYRYQARLGEGNCSNTSNIVTLTVNDAPVILNFTPVSGGVCRGSEVVYTVTATGSTALHYQWQQANSITGIYTGVGANQNSYTVTGITTSESGRSIKVTVIDNNNCTTTSDPPSVVTVSQLPVVVAGASPNAICSGATTNIVLSNPNNIPGTTFTWTVAAPTTITGAAGQTTPATGTISQALTSTATADVIVTYTVTPSANGCIGNSTNAEMTVHPQPDVRANSNASSLCTGHALTIELTSPRGVTDIKFKWVVNTSTAVTGWSNQTTPEAGPISATPISSSMQDENISYHITPVVSGCSGTPADVVIIIKSPVRIDDDPKSIMLCTGAEMKLNVVAVGSPPIEYQWKRNDADIPGATLASYTMPINDSEGGGRFKVLVKNSCGTATSKEAVLTTNKEAVLTGADISASPLTQACLEPVAFDYRGPTHIFDWDFGDNSTHSNFENPVHNFVAPGEYVVKLTVTTPDNCHKVFTININITGKATNPFTGDWVNQKGIDFYPVPLEKKLAIQSEKKLVSVSISAITGSVLFLAQANDFSTLIDTSALTPGIYILSVETDNGISRFKVVK